MAGMSSVMPMARKAYHSAVAFAVSIGTPMLPDWFSMRRANEAHASAALHDSIHGANRHAQGSSLDDHIVIQRAHLVHTCTAKRHSPLHSKTLGSEEVAHALVVFVGVRVDDPDFTRIRTQTPSSSQSSPSEGATITAPMTMVVFTNGTGQSALQVLRQKARQRRPWRRHKNTSAGRSVGV